MSQDSDSSFPRQDDATSIETMQVRIQDGMCHSEDASKKFIGQEELRAVWADLGLRRMFPGPVWEEYEVQTIRDCYMRVFSILVMIAWPGICGHDKSRFRKHFLNRPHHELADSNLPLAKQKLGFLKEYAISFREKQFAFCPVIIEEREASYIQEVAADLPLPFTGEEFPLGEGASGRVRKVVIARYCFRAMGKTLNAKEMHVACKTFHVDGRKRNFDRELRRLGWVKRAKEGTRIMKHIAALAHGGNVMILLPMAEHFDLDVFLRGGFKPTRDTDDARQLYDFDSRFPKLKDADLALTLVKELCALASAVRWLHEGSEASQELYQSLAHMDLKPENILVVEDSNSPIGRWMLSDFGVSLFGLSKDILQGGSTRTTASSYVNGPQRGCGTYQPPEIRHETIDGRKCDVWSFGCILIDVMSFGLGRTGLFHEVRRLRNDGGDDYFYQSKVRGMDAQTPISNDNTEIKTQIRLWLETQKRSASHPPWVQDYINITELTLKCDPLERPSIGFIVGALSKLRQGEQITIHHFFPAGGRPKYGTSTMLTEADTPAFAYKPVPGPSSNRVQQVNTTRFDDQYESEGRAVREGFVKSGTLFDTDTASLPTAEQMVSSSLPSEHTRPQSHSRDSFALLDRDSLTDGSGSIQIGLDPGPRSPAPTGLSFGLGAQSLQVRPPSAKSVPVKVSRRSATVKNQERMTALALSPSGDYAALLFRHACYVYAISGDTPTETTSINLDRKVGWSRVCIGSHYLVLYGIERSRPYLKRVLVFDTCDGRAIQSFDDEINGVQISDVTISTEGVTACAHGNHLLIHDLSSRMASQHFQIERGLTIKNLAFSANGRWLCAWAISIEQGRDRSYFWKCSQQAIDPSGSGSYHRVDDASIDFSLWCYPDSPACVIHERGYGLTSIIRQNARPDPNPESRQDLPIPNLVAACITPRKTLIYVVDPSLLSSRRAFRFEERLLMFEPDRPTCISKEGTVLGTVITKWEKSAITVAAQGESTEVITLCTFKRNTIEVIKYIIDH